MSGEIELGPLDEKKATLGAADFFITLLPTPISTLGSLQYKYYILHNLLLNFHVCVYFVSKL